MHILPFLSSSFELYSHYYQKPEYDIRIGYRITELDTINAPRYTRGIVKVIVTKIMCGYPDDKNHIIIWLDTMMAMLEYIIIPNITFHGEQQLKS